MKERPVRKHVGRPGPTPSVEMIFGLYPGDANRAVEPTEPADAKATDPDVAPQYLLL